MKLIKNDCVYDAKAGTVICTDISKASEFDFGIDNGKWNVLAKDLFTYDATTKKYTFKF